jgi:hypothetical protein
MQYHVEECSVAPLCNRIGTKPVVSYAKDTYKLNLKDYN